MNSYIFVATDNHKEENVISTTTDHLTDNLTDHLLEDEDIYQIFDKTFKKIITLSSVAVTNLINALFQTNYPPDSTITYNWTEFEDDKLKRILADTILTINGKYSYHLEAQMEKDRTIVFRVFEYGFHHAQRNRITKDGAYVLPFPRPVVIYLYYEGNVPDEYTLTLQFHSQNQKEEHYEYKVPVLKLQDTTSKELNDKKMVILIPFHLLKFRKAVKEGNLSNRLTELKRMYETDIIGSIETNRQIGNITTEDAYKLKLYVDMLWRYLLKHHKELEAFGDMTDESFMTEADIICERLHKAEDLLKEKDSELQEKDSELQEREAAWQSTLEEKQMLQSTLQEKDSELQEKDAELERLRAELESLKNKRD